MNSRHDACSVPSKKGYMSLAYLLYGMSREAAQALREAASSTGMQRVKNIAYPMTTVLGEQQQPFFVDVSGHSYDAVRLAKTQLEDFGYKTHIYVMEAAMPCVLDEGSLNRLTTYGMLRKLNAVTVHEARQIVALMEAEAPKPKEPTEVDRLKVDQKRQSLQMKTRQNDDLLQAKERELEKKSREDSEKIENGNKPKDITR
jgi:hypothetical protein